MGWCLLKGGSPSDAEGGAVQFREFLPSQQNVGVMSHQAAPTSVDPMIRYFAGFPFPALNEVIS
jgi:hypothetical protein